MNTVRRCERGGLAYTSAGSGEPLVLVHGLGGSRETWRHLVETLALTHTVITPDLPGHGDSDAPAGDYSVGAHATAVRDLLVCLGLPSATIVGHSLGGGVALQFAYQFPERTQRLVLVSSGGLGQQCTPALRAATLPYAETVVAALSLLPPALTRRVLPAMPALIARQDAGAVADALHDLGDARRRRTFIRTARTVIDWRGQTVSAAGHLDLLAGIPVLMAWGSDDRTIPPEHHRAVAARNPAFHTAEIPGAGHYPHETAPELLLPAIHAFLRSTRPFRYSEASWRDALDQSALDQAA
ncbi:alpha/beta fold hydrolase [Asanoa sp. WMMD1127]|uniref:alpha/beta fold hydrolase n=1 Tax=Asanoa sp. WMMD1127 TaxID=3016107 RepID=UPI002415ADEC|nr:alpha/beta fold hydrolase [Asanoa sp. WMMD1127]MDG4827540.1 alpha/beta fold hydrolase [Asanoa sp. WMMD1127]